MPKNQRPRVQLQEGELGWPVSLDQIWYLRASESSWRLWMTMLYRYFTECKWKASKASSFQQGLFQNFLNSLGFSCRLCWSVTLDDTKYDGSRAIGIQTVSPKSSYICVCMYLQHRWTIRLYIFLMLPYYGLAGPDDTWSYCKLPSLRLQSVIEVSGSYCNFPACRWMYNSPWRSFCQSWKSLYIIVFAESSAIV